MSRKLTIASTIAIVASATFALLAADGSGAAAQARDPMIVAQNVAQTGDQTVSQNSAGTSDAQDDAALVAPSAPADPVSTASFAQLVSAQATEEIADSRELNCLAGAIYFESKSEPLLGQLAVGRVIVARSRSGRFPNSYCGVVYQPSQFSFVRGNGMPGIDHASRGWKNAMAIARIAHEGSWQSPVEGALYFHAARSAPRWRLARVAQIGNHVFYR